MDLSKLNDHEREPALETHIDELLALLGEARTMIEAMGRKYLVPRERNKLGYDDLCARISAALDK